MPYVGFADEAIKKAGAPGRLSRLGRSVLYRAPCGAIT
jgi:hypothetical protein